VGYPRFKAATRFNTAVHRAVTGAKWDSAPYLTQTRAYFKGVGHVKVKQHRPVVGLVKTLTIKREGRRWYVILAAEQQLPAPLPKTGAMIGIDLATGDNGLACTPRGADREPGIRQGFHGEAGRGPPGPIPHEAGIQPPP
jgi:putative transposase